MTNILAFDTSGPHCAVALLSAGQIKAACHEDMAKGQAERLMPLIEEVMSEGGLAFGDLSAIGVGIGPGNFTGIRISVAAARGLALSLGIPAVGVSSLEAQAFGADRPIWSLIDARRDHFYAQRFTETDAAAPLLLSAQEIEVLEGKRVGPDRIAFPAQTIARITAIKLAEAEGIPLVRPAPLYIRSADAAPPRDPAPVILPG